MPTTLDTPWDAAYPTVGTIAPPAQQEPAWDAAYSSVGVVAPDPYEGLMEEMEQVEQERAAQFDSADQEFRDKHGLGERPEELPITSYPSGMPDVYPARESTMPAWRALLPEERARRTKWFDDYDRAVTKEKREEKKERLLDEGLAKGIKGRTGQGQARYVAKRIPFLRDLLAIHENIELDFAVASIEGGGRDPDDLRIIARAMNDASYEQQRTWGQWVRDNVTALPAYGVELASTSGAYTGGKEAAKQSGKMLLKTTLGAVAKQKIKKLATREGLKGLAGSRAVSFAAGAGKWALPRAAGVAAQTLANPQMIGRNLTARMMAEFDLTEDEAGRLQLVITDEGDKSILSALPKAFVETFIEIGAERSGAAVLSGAGRAVSPLLSKLPKSARLSALKAAIIRKYLRSKPGATVSKAMSLLKKGQWHGLVAETMEERVEEIAKGGLGLEDNFGTTGLAFTDPGQAAYNLSVEAATLAVPGAAMTAARAPGVIRDVAKAKGRLEKARERQETSQTERSAEQLEVADWVAENPESAAELAALDKPTRTQFESFAPVVKETTAKGRVKWVERVRRELAAQEAPPDAVEPSVPETISEPAQAPEAPKAKRGLGKKKAVKQRWQMTEKEDKALAASTGFPLGQARHSQVVAEAIARGEDVPIDIIKSYPDVMFSEAPWLMTKAEWEKYVKTGRDVGQALQGFREELAKDALGEGFVVPVPEEEGRPATHRAIVESALIQGKPVPAEVLADYPDLAPAPKPKRGLGKKRPSPESLGAVGGVLDTGDIVTGLVNLASKTQTLAKRAFTAPGLLPGKTFEKKIRRDGRVKKIQSEMKNALRDLDTAVQKEEGWGKRQNLDENEVQMLDEALKGDPVAIAGLPLDVAVAIGTMRAHIDSLSQLAIDLGVVEGELAATFEAKKGVYAKRSYRVHTDPMCAEKGHAEVRSLDEGFIRSEYQDIRE